MTYTGTKWAERLNYLAEIEAGWYDGEGEAINPEVLDQADSILHSLDSDAFNVPAMFPLLSEENLEGGITMEWSQKHSPHHLNIQISNNFAYEVYVFDFRSKEETSSLETNSFEEAMRLLSENLIRVGFAESKKSEISEELSK